MELKVYNIDGTESSETVQLPDDIFAMEEPNHHLVYQAVRVFLAHQRQGTHKTKERAEVRGGGKKPFRQKGTGGARRGTNRSPLMPGGGTIFGPKPHKYTIALPKKAAKAARRSALSLKAKENQIMIIDDFNFENPKTKDMAGILKALKLDGKKTLLLTGNKSEALYKSGRNIPALDVMTANTAATYHLVNNKMILMQKSAIEDLVKSLTV